MKYIIIPIILLILLTILAFLFRRKHIQTIASLEIEKQQIQHKPIFEEMTKVKQLNMTGETEEKFERWRNEWTEVMDVHMPSIDSLLFDAEDFVDRFRFRKAGDTEKQIVEKIRFCEQRMNTILSELHELIGSEEKNRIEMEKLKEQHRSARKTVLAHQHSFGMTADPLEKKLESFLPKFEEYDELTANGNYLQAREIVLSQTAEGDRLFHLIHEIPSLLTELQTKIPATIRELRNGIREMEEQSYYLQHLELVPQLTSIEAELEKMLEQMKELQIETIQQRMNEINDRMDSFYELLEQEVNAKRYVEEHYDEVVEHYQRISELLKEVEAEATVVQQSYRLDENEVKIPQNGLKRLHTITKRLEVLDGQKDDHQSAYSILEKELKEIADELEQLSEEQDAFKNRLKNLRVDEHLVRSKVDELARQLQAADRKLHRGNIPGIPDEMEARLEEADEQIYIVTQSLQEVPLNMMLVDGYLVNAEKAVQDVVDKVDEMLENVILIEWIIQYGNRYRTTNPEMHARLLEAEESFRQFRYAKALEEAATAVEDVEPGAMRKIEDLVKEHM